jgi:hypothetical protein
MATPYTPDRRPLKIYAYDPLLGRTAGNRITVDIAYEPLGLGPKGTKVEVIDYDHTNGTFYQPVNLNDPGILINGGIEPTESDPRFHQQMVYAVIMMTLENFERALGREIRWRKSRQLKVFPHAFHGANAFFEPDSLGLYFGYFRADEQRPGESLPSQWIYSCLSHDIIAHEMTHAVVDRLRRHFMDPTNRDVIAFHEAFADIVAIFQHFGFPDVLRDAVRKGRADLREPGPLIELAREFGHGTGRGAPLRSALDPGEAPDASLYKKVFEPHARGSILVAAVFDAFFAIYRTRIEDLVRLATSGTGVLPPGAIPPDLVNRVSEEAAAASRAILASCMRAFEYLPPVDVTFGDFLRAVVTADRELNPDDSFGLRAALIEAFRLRGIYPGQVTSLAEDSLIWERPHSKLGHLQATWIADRLMKDLRAYDRRIDETATDYDPGSRSSIAQRLYAYAKDNAPYLYLKGERIHVAGFHSNFRVGTDGKLLTDVVVQFVEQGPKLAEFGGLREKAGTTVVFSAKGVPRYVIAKPLPYPRMPRAKREQAEQRLSELRDFVDWCDERDPLMAWAKEDYVRRRMDQRFKLSSIHRNLSY